MEWDLKEEYNEIEIVELGLHGFLWQDLPYLS